jgi:hypothetical protein
MENASKIKSPFGIDATLPLTISKTDQAALRYLLRLRRYAAPSSNSRESRESCEQPVRRPMANPNNR